MNRFPKNERLCSRKQIDALFATGGSTDKYTSEKAVVDYEKKIHCIIHSRAADPRPDCKGDHQNQHDQSSIENAQRENRQLSETVIQNLTSLSNRL